MSSLGGLYYAHSSGSRCRRPSRFRCCRSPAFAQKQGGTLRISHRDNPPSASIHEEATISVNQPFMAVFNNLVVFDPKEKINSPDKIVPDLAESWTWSTDNKTKLTFKLRSGVKWHDGKPFTAKDVKCTWDALSGKADEKSDLIRKNPRKVWYNNLEGGHGRFRHRGYLHAQVGRSLRSCRCWPRATRPCTPATLSGRDMRSKPIGTGPFKVVDFKRNESIKLVRNPDYWKKGRPYLDAIDWKIVPNRSTRMLGFVAGEFDMTFDSDVTLPAAEGHQERRSPTRSAKAAPSNVNQQHPDQSAKRRRSTIPRCAVRLLVSMDPKPFNDILFQGNALSRCGHAAAAGRRLGYAQGNARRRCRVSATDVEKNRAEARKIMEGLRLLQGQAAQGQGVDPQYRDLPRSRCHPDRPAQECVHRGRA